MVNSIIDVIKNKEEVKHEYNFEEAKYNYFNAKKRRSKINEGDINGTHSIKIGTITPLIKLTNFK